MTMKRMIVPSLLAIAMAAPLASCGDNSIEFKDAETSQATETVKTATLGSFGLALEHMDHSIKPGDNFFMHMNGGWMEANEIPADRSSYGGFAILRDVSEERVKAIIEASAKTEAAPGSEEQKIGDFYASFLDQEAINAAGLAPIAADLATIAAVETHADAARLMGDPGMGLNSPMAGWVDVDVKDIENYIFYVTQAGLGMPDKDYYLGEDERSQELRAAYLAFLTTMLTEAGDQNAVENAQAVMEFETELAKVHWKLAKRRDRSLTYNKMTTEEMKAFAEGFPWDAMLEASGLDDQAAFIVRETDAIQNSARIFADTPVSTLKSYMTAHYMGGMSAYLPRQIDEANFEFYGRTLRGTPEPRARWKRAVSQIDNYMGEMVGKVYVKEHFPESSKAQMLDLIENLRGAFREGIDNLEWMGEETKAQAQDKLAKFNPKIGYPDEWTDYSTLQVNRDDLIGTVKSANAWQWQDMIGKLGGPIDRGEWGMNPQTVNAYYRPSLNEIVFPAAILQAPFFDPAADPAVNYGGIGAVIGHEMGHGFDDQGRKTDGDGRQRDWWTESDGEAFKTRADELVAQYDAFEPLPGEHINGRLTLGENIGDLTGLTMAYAAYKRSLGGKEAPVIDGLTGDQRFFLAYAQIWQVKMRDEALSNRLKTDSHSPGEYRANGIVRNFDQWYEAFDIQPGDALYLAPEKRVKIW